MKDFEKLNENELKELKGALYALDMVADDILNKNSTDNCKCTYNNQALITNDNSVSTCKCNCI